MKCTSDEVTYGETCNCSKYIVVLQFNFILLDGYSSNKYIESTSLYSNQIQKY